MLRRRGDGVKIGMKRMTTSVWEEVEENRVENLKEEKVKRKREDVKGNVQRKREEDVDVNYIYNI